ncbi:MAG: ABC transporter permease [Burkholderiales bacterium]|nr:ABC transporter permease [Burkholderiales bacterium]
MASYALQRLIQSVFVLLAASIVVFLAVYGIGNPIELLVPPQASALEREELVRRLGLDLPLWRQYLVFAWNALHGDLGRSFVHGVPAIELILTRLPATLELVVLAMTIALAGGIPLGLLAGLNTESRASRLIMGGTVLGYSLPNFWKGMMLILVFAVLLGWLPTSGRGETVEILGLKTSLLTLDGLKHLILPALNLSIPNMALMIRLVAAGTADAKAQDYVKYARAKGVRPRRIVGRHILRNILIPVVTVAGIEFGSLVAFSTITETVFAWPGMGKLLIDSIYQLDRPIVVAYIMLATFLFVTVNLLVDLAYAALDPRVRLVGEAG